METCVGICPVANKEKRRVERDPKRGDLSLAKMNLAGGVEVSVLQNRDFPGVLDEEIPPKSQASCCLLERVTKAARLNPGGCSGGNEFCPHANGEKGRSFWIAVSRPVKTEGEF